MHKALIVLLIACFACHAAGGVVPLVPGAGVVYAAGSSQYHTQDAFGNYNYGYAGPTGVKHEKRVGGVVSGTYSHPLPDGRILTNNYVADAFGFRSDLAPTAAKDFAPKVLVAAPYAAPYGVAGPYGHGAGYHHY